MRVACLQLCPAANIEANLARIATAARAAAAAGARLLVTPEMGATGYAIWDAIPALAQPRDGGIVRQVEALAAAHGIAIVVGFPEREGEKIYNTAVLAQPGGERTFYRKCHLFGPDEKAAFVPSMARPAIFEIGGLRAAMLICYDVEFPEMARMLALAGVKLLLVPTALPKSQPANRVAQSLLPVRAFENHIFIVYAGLCGEENGSRYQGGSLIAGPDGEILAGAGQDETLLITELNPARYAAMDLDPYLEDRLPELYQFLIQGE